ncbi:hypothetical protein [Paramagnetospirillum kuznetsovii]|nr:hypothetical protein [Paramagnetospirillum kuznetsovii]
MICDAGILGGMPVVAGTQDRDLLPIIRHDGFVFIARCPIKLE